MNLATSKALYLSHLTNPQELHQLWSRALHSLRSCFQMFKTSVHVLQFRTATSAVHFHTCTCIYHLIHLVLPVHLHLQLFLQNCHLLHAFKFKSANSSVLFYSFPFSDLLSTRIAITYSEFFLRNSLFKWSLNYKPSHYQSLFYFIHSSPWIMAKIIKFNFSAVLFWICLIVWELKFLRKLFFICSSCTNY